MKSRRKKRHLIMRWKGEFDNCKGIIKALRNRPIVQVFYPSSIAKHIATLADHYDVPYTQKTSS